MSYDFIYNSSKINSLRIACDTERLKYVRPPISRSNVFKGLEGAQCRHPDGFSSFLGAPKAA